jgi:hypothetical protein
MKLCAYCGRENQEDAARCSECGSDEFKNTESLDLPPLDEQEELVTLITCPTLSQSDLMVSRLEAAGIETFVPDQFLMQAVGLPMTYGYIRVQVHRRDHAQAKAILDLPEPET